MMKKCVLFTLFSYTAFAGLQAQVSSNSAALQKAAQDFSKVENNNYAKALQLASEKGWPLVITGKNNTTATLVGVDVYGLPKYYITTNNAIAAATTRASQLWPGGNTGLNLSGSSANMKNKVAVWDGGSALGTHVELNGRITVKDGAALSDHSTHVTGTIIATGINPVAKGMAYATQGLISYNYALDVSEMFTESSNIILSNHSYGVLTGWVYNTTQSRWEFYGRPSATEDYKFGYYSNDAQMLDSIAYNAPNYLIVKAAGNSRDQNGPAVGQPYYRPDNTGSMQPAGNRPADISDNNSYGIISWDANAKNILTVGAISGLPAGYNKAQDVLMSNFSCWGPTDDGRIKPDVVADGVNVTSSISTSNTAYATYSGTSMATPNATGSLFLLQEYYSQLKAGAFMRSATLKGLAIHTADEAGANAGPDYQFGWGLLNVEKASAVIKAAISSNNASTSAHVVYENSLGNGQTFTLPVIASGNGKLVATICWTDVKGNVDLTNTLNNPAKKLINDLDIRITAGATTYLPWKLNPSAPANAATTGDNDLDNVEKTEADNVIPGQVYTITITHKGTLARGQQAYSLLVSGVGGQAYCASAATSTAGSRINNFSFGSINNANPAGCTSYTNYTSISTNVEPGQTLPLAVNVGSCDASVANKIVKLFIDYNNNGSFADAGELVGQSAVINGNGTFNGAVVTPGTLTAGSSYIMRVIVQETSNPADISPCGAYANGETQDYVVKVVAAANDISVTGLSAPLSTSCASPTQYITLNLQNKGSVDKTAIPLTAIVKNGATIVATLNAVFPGTLSAGSLANYTFQTPFTSVAGATYTITAYATASGDQSKGNDTINNTIVIAAPPAPAGIARICGPSATLQATNPAPGVNYFWFDSPTATTPITNGTPAQTATIPASKIYYLSSGARGSAGIVSKNNFPSAGDYQATGGNYMKYSAKVPVTLESVRLFTRYPGTVTIIAADITNVNGTSYSYTTLASQTVNVHATNPNPTPGTVAATAADLADTGAVFYVNLSLPAGDHAIIVLISNGATVFRNNNITGNPYPFTVPGVFSITGNSATSATDANFFQNFYYYLYDMKVKTLDCVSDRVAIIASESTTVLTPVITQAGDSLISSIATGNQWYLNGVAIPGAINKTYKPVQSGLYNVLVADGAGCNFASNSINSTVTATVDVNGAEIGLTVAPNPSNGLFNLLFDVKTKNNLKIEVLNGMGQRVYSKIYPGFVGRFSSQLNISNLAAGVYILNIQHNNKWYIKKVLVTK
jgi:hypothetical protein